MSDSFLLFDKHSKDEISESILPLFTEKPLPKEWQTDSPAKFSAGSRIYVYVSDENASAVIEAAVAGDWILAILPNKNSPYLNSGFCIESNLQNVIKEAEVSSPQKVDILRCNNKIVLSSAVIGYSFNLLSTAKHLKWSARIKLALFNIINIRSIRPQKMTFVNDDGINFCTAAIGLIIIKHSHGSSLSRHILSNTQVNDGMCHSMILAPRSVMQTLRFYVMASLQDTMNLPDFLGTIKTDAYVITSGERVNYKIDGLDHQAESLEVKTEFQVLQLLIGDSLPIKDISQNKHQEIKPCIYQPVAQLMP